MRFEVISHADHLGPISLYDLRRALELDSGSFTTNIARDEAGVQRFSHEVIAEIERKMAIVLPVF